ncbi:unnamed protein product [Heterosigma akashiwo]
MAFPHKVCLLLALCALMIARTDSSCPDECTCIDTTAHCSYAGLTGIPTDLPSTTTHLYLQGNEISSISYSDFIGVTTDAAGDTVSEAMTGIELLRLDKNPISTLARDVFEDFSELKYIYLPQTTKFTSPTNFGTIYYDDFDGFTRSDDVSSLEYRDYYFYTVDE